MKILVIGSRGFIGTHCHSWFLNKGYDTYGCDIQPTDDPQNYFQIDSKQPSFQTVFKKINPDFCVNCSGAANVPDSFKDPDLDYKLNTGNLHLILDSLRLFSPDCKFINLSSAAVYGNPASLPISESDQANPISPYGENKLKSEDILKKFAQNFDLMTCSLRVFSVYGPGLRKQLFWDLFQKSKRQDNIALFGDGNESRDFIYITDLVRVVELVLGNASFKGEVLNVANGQEVLIKEAVKIFLKNLDWQGNYTFSGQKREGDPDNWCADIQRIIALGYQRSVNFETGLMHYIEWVKENG